MNRFATIIWMTIAAVLLTGCDNGPVFLSKDKPYVFEMKDDAFKCEKVVLPDPTNMTEIDNGKLIAYLFRSVTICYDSQETVKVFLKDQKVKIEAPTK